MEQHIEIAGGRLCFEKGDRGLVITGYQGAGARAAVPEEIGGTAVTEIGRKAFLSSKSLRRIALPDTIEKIDDWAFAYCSNLELVRLPCRNLQFGKGVFLDCGKLAQLEGTAAPGELLAAAVTAYGAYYLLDLPEAGSRRWLEQWDRRLLTVMETPDSEGYSRQVLCGEEDYGSTDFDAYQSEKRMQKARLALLRLLRPQGLSGSLRELLTEYLLKHTKGSTAGEEAWRVILQEHGNHREYYGLFRELGCVGADNLDGILGDIGEQYPEMKAYFLSGGREQDFFGELSAFD